MYGRTENFVCHIFVNNVCGMHDAVRREKNLEMLVIRSERYCARDWLFLTGILFCVPPEHEKGF
jgi:hypothetical protein